MADPATTGQGEPQGTLPGRPPRASLLRRWLPRVLAASFATLVSLVALELATRAIFDRHGMHYAIEMWKYARLLKRPSPVAGMGHEHIPGGRARLMGVDVEINSQGLRGPELSVAKPPGVYRILALGDSITFGWGAAFDASYPAVLQGILNRSAATAPADPAATVRRYEVINSGVGNYNTVQEVAYFRERGLALQPDLVMLGFFLNDAEPQSHPARHFLARNSYLYVFAASGYDSLSRGWGLHSDWRDYYAGLYRDSAPGWQACRGAIAELIDLCHEHQLPLVVLLIPELHQLGNDYPFRYVHQKVAALAQGPQVSVLDLTSAFDGQNPPTLWVSPGDAHPNAQGHQILAEAIARGLTTTVLKPPLESSQTEAP
ncbi:MAG: SGNH/GDSL hydrolase family protein [Pirellulales bacterium]|nr:SGNH/GDSL hydrolase family protein [Pirellulales bacterium]